MRNELEGWAVCPARQDWSEMALCSVLWCGLTGSDWLLEIREANWVHCSASAFFFLLLFSGLGFMPESLEEPVFKFCESKTVSMLAHCPLLFLPWVVRGGRWTIEDSQQMCGCVSGEGQSDNLVCTEWWTASFPTNFPTQLTHQQLTALLC